MSHFKPVEIASWFCFQNCHFVSETVLFASKKAISRYLSYSNSTKQFEKGVMVAWWPAGEEIPRGEFVCAIEGQRQQLPCIGVQI